MNNKSILLCVDLNQATSQQHQQFSSAMEQEGWSKHDRIRNVWTGSFEKGVSEQQAVSAAKSGIASSAVRSQIPSFEVLIHIGETAPIEYNVRPEAILRPQAQ